jgi:plasmid maintenance system antidote protein VapI
MQELEQALAMDVAGIARAVGVTARTVRAWIAGARKPAERNRIKLARLVLAAQEENSSADSRFSATLDRALTSLRAKLRSADEQKLFEANRALMRSQFAAPEARAARHEVWASYRAPAATMPGARLPGQGVLYTA